MTRRGQAALLSGVMEVTSLEEAFEEFRREGGKPSIGQMQLLREVELLYIQREDIEIVDDEAEGEPDDSEATPDLAASESLGF